MKKLLTCLIIAVFASLSSAGCKLTITTFTAPDAAETGEVITLTIVGEAVDNGEGTTEYGIILQIPENWEVKQATSDLPFNNTIAENSAYQPLYTAEPGYKVWVGTNKQSDTEGRTVTATVSILTGTFSGTAKQYHLKALAGALREGVWVTDDPAGLFKFESVTSDTYVETIVVTKVTDQTTTTTTTVPPTTTTTIPSDQYSEQPYSSLQIYLAEGSPEKEYYDVDEIIHLYVNYKNSKGENANLSLFEFIDVNWVTNNSIIATVLDGQVEFKDNGKVKVIASSGGMTSHYDFMVGEASGATKNYGNLIILAGGDQNDSSDKMKNAIQYLANRMYSIFKTRGFTDEDIYYINHINTQDLDGDGVADGIVDQTDKTVETLQNAIKWAETQANDGPLYLYVVNHGEKNATFLIDSGQILTATQFDAFLDNFEDNTNRVSIAMLEACYSGSFIDQLADTDRVIFSSSAADKYSYLSDAGDVSFSQFLSTHLLSGYNWEESFDLASNDITVIGAPYSGMNPQKTIGSQVVVGKVFGDFIMASFLPKVKTYTPGGTVDTNIEQTFSVELDMLDIGGVTVWATVTPPNYQPPAVTGEYTTPTLGLNTFNLANVESSKTFTGSYTFPCNGTYQVTYYVKDSSGNVISVAPQTFVATGGSECDFITSISTAWNLISLPVIPDDPSVAAIFSGIKENVASAWKWVDGKWAVFLPGLEDEGASYAFSKGFGQLTEIGCGEGFWVNSSTNQSLSVTGTQPSDTSSSLTEAWNLVGLKSNQSETIDALISGNKDNIASIWKWDNDKWGVYLPAQEDGGDAYAESKGFSVFSNIEPGEGFWVNCTQAVVLP